MKSRAELLALINKQNEIIITFITIIPINRDTAVLMAEALSAMVQAKETLEDETQTP